MVNGEGEVEERDSDGDGDEGDEESYEGTSGSLGGNRPFILPENWTIINFYQR